MPESNDLQLLSSAVLLSRAHQHEDAKNLLIEFVKRRPKDGSAWLLLSQVQLQLRNHEAALQAALAAVGSLPGSSHAHYALVRAHKARGDLAAAETWYQRPIDADPANTDALTSLAIIRRGTGRLDEAIKLYERVLAIDPNHAAARVNLENALDAKLARPAATTSNAADHRWRSPAVEQRRLAAIALVSEGRLRDALAAFESLLALTPQDSELWLMAGIVAQELGRPPNVLLPFFETAARLDPHNAIAAEAAHKIRFLGGIPDTEVAGLRRNHSRPDTWRGLFVPAIAESTHCDRTYHLLAQPAMDGVPTSTSDGNVVLDTVHFNGMNSSLECLAMGTPVVTLPTTFQRGRHTQAMYRKMEIPDCIAADPKHYADIAVRIGTDRQYAAHLRDRILVRNHVLFENPTVVREFERFFTETTALAWEERSRFTGGPFSRELTFPTRSARLLPRPATAGRLSVDLNVDEAVDRLIRTGTHASAPWQCLNRLPLPHGQASLRPGGSAPLRFSCANRPRPLADSIADRR